MPASWGSSEHPTHCPRAPRDTADMYGCLLRAKKSTFISKISESKEETKRDLLQSSISGRFEVFLSPFLKTFLEFCSSLTQTCTDAHLKNHKSTGRILNCWIYVSTGIACVYKPILTGTVQHLRSHIPCNKSGSESEQDTGCTAFL